MKRIWLKVEGFQLYNFSRSRGTDIAAWADIQMGQESFAVKNYFFRLEKDGQITQNPAMADMRFLDIPLLHHDRKKPKMLLEDVLGKAIYDLYLAGEKSGELKALLEGKTELTEFPFFKPAEWQGKSLRIPVDFVALRGLSATRSADGWVYADIIVGEHLIFWKQLIFDCTKFCYGGSKMTPDSSNAIYDKRIVAIINDLLNRKDLQERICYLSETRGFESGSVIFFEKTANCDERRIAVRALPHPVRLY